MDVKQSSPSITDSALRLPSELPDLPTEVITRFPAMGTWLDEQRRWWEKAQNALQDFARATLDVTEIAGILTVDPNTAAIYIKRSRGDGAWGNPDTGFYVDRNSFFSLGSSLTWNPGEQELIIDGTIIATSGTIGGFEIGTDYIRDVADMMGLSSAITGADDVRFWAGDSFANRGSAPFRVTESGALVATSATISGSITATSGSIGGFTIGSDFIRDAANSFGLASTVTGGDDVRFWAGDTFANRATAPVRIKESGTIEVADITTGNYIKMSTAGLQVGGDSTRGQFFVLNNGGSGQATVKYNGTTVGTWSTGATYSILTVQQSAPAGSLTMDPRNGYSALVGNAGTALLSLFGPTSSVVFQDGGNFSLFSASFSGSGSGLTALNGSNISTGTVAAARLGSGTTNSTTILRGDSTWVAYAPSAFTDTTNASNISSGTLANARLPSAISVTSLQTANFFANVTTASVDAAAANLRVFSDTGRTTQTWRVDNTNGDMYVQNTRVVRAQYGTPNPGGGTDPEGVWAAACLVYHGLGV